MVVKDANGLKIAIDNGETNLKEFKLAYVTTI